MSLNKSKIVCLYHRDCFDGMGAAWVVSQVYPYAQFIAADYHEPVPNLSKDTDVVIVDFSYDLDQTKAIIRKVSSVIMLDHHPRSKEIVNAVDYWVSHNDEGVKFQSTTKVHYSDGDSGALMAWRFFFPNEEPPKAIEFISDHDTHTFKYGNDTRDFIAGLGTYPLKLNVWKELFEENAGVLCDQMRKTADIAKRVRQNAINWAIEHTLREVPFATLGIEGMANLDFNIQLINAPRTIAGDALLQLLEVSQAPFAMAYFDKNIGRKFSLRSKTFDTRKVSSFFGGEGHTSASGFTVPRSHPLAQI